MSSRRLSRESLIRLRPTANPRFHSKASKSSPKLRLQRSTGCAWCMYEGYLLVYGCVGVAAEALECTEAWWPGCGVRGRNPRFLVF
ncbi:hypothetical protein F383_20202 [Gossypium arboreum]|uniref:Uncharacterized protein n=1 Tax=Gossypium arboreum TaxID=29729 RepID=A0A0B0NLN6_GOSAR|nr:hypothetical protein F383_20202 [Gossypium arboreum]